MPITHCVIANRYKAIDDDDDDDDDNDDAMIVPIQDLIRTSRRKKKLRASRIPAPIVRDSECRLTPLQELYPALEPTEKHTSWKCLRARQNYEAHMFHTHGVEIEGIDIEVIKQSSLGIEGWLGFAPIRSRRK